MSRQVAMVHPVNMPGPFHDTGSHPNNNVYKHVMV